MPMPMTILLDSNVWRYIVDANATAKVLQAALKSSHRIAIAPAVVYEALRTENPAIRHALVSAMTLSHWKRLMPEAYSEAYELKVELQRLRSPWLRHPKDLTLYKRLRHDWIRSRGGFWDRVRIDADGERRRIDGPLLELARADAQVGREEGKLMPPQWQSARLTELVASPQSPISGWMGEPVELWRLNALTSFQLAMSLDDHPYRDWLNGEVSLDVMMFQSKELTRFWLYDADTQRMQRCWLRSAFEFQQRFHKITDGTPADSQLSTYLVDVDVMLSADKNFVRFAERCRQEAPFLMGCSTLVPGGEDAVDAVIAALDARR